MDKPKQGAGVEVENFESALGTRASDCHELVASVIDEETPVMQAGEGRVGLFSLPPEIRIQIYELVLIRRRHCHDTKRGDASKPSSDESLPKEPITIYIRDALNEPGEYFEVTSIDWTAQPALTRTCRQIREESLPVYYGHNHFEYSDHTTPWQDILQKLQAGQSVEKISWDLREYDDHILGDAGLWLERIGEHSVSMIKHFKHMLPAKKWISLPRLSAEGFEKHGEDIARVLADCLRRKNSPLPPQGMVKVQVRVSKRDGFGEEWRFETWRELKPLVLNGEQS